MTPFERETQVMQDKLTKAVEIACLGRGIMQWEAYAEEAADKVVAGTGWRYRFMNSLGRLPKAVLISYDHREDERGQPY